MVDPKNKAEVIELLARAAHRGSLGLFLGTGFSVAVTRGAAPRWKTLLTLTAKELDLPDPVTDAQNIGVSLPEIASGMIVRLAEKLRAFAPYDKLDSHALRVIAQGQVKESAAKIVASLEPDADELKILHEQFHRICPAWVVTTNYDDLFQTIHGKTHTFLANDVIVPTRDLTPVWQIHGSVLVPQSIVLTQEDYVENLRPATYRQFKLAHMMVESTTLMLGYSYGDVNVQAAAAIAASAGLLEIRKTRRPGDSLIVQAVHAPTAGDAVIHDKGTLAIEIEDIKQLFQQIVAEVARLQERLGRVHKFFETLRADPDSTAEMLLKHPDKMTDFTAIVSEFPTAYYDFDLMRFLAGYFSRLSAKAYSRSGFPYYGTWLDQILTMLLKWDLAEMPPSIVELLAGQLASVVDYVDPDGRHTFGSSWAATDNWHMNKAALAARKDLLEALGAYSRRHPTGARLRLLLENVN